jgi:hypothetical protein
MDVVLHIGHRVREDTNVQRIAALPADLIPDLREQVASSLTLASMMMQLHPWPMRAIVASVIISCSSTAHLATMAWIQQSSASMAGWRLSRAAWGAARAPIQPLR